MTNSWIQKSTEESHREWIQKRQQLNKNVESLKRLIDNFLGREILKLLSANETCASMCCPNGCEGSHDLILILDRDLQNLPFESIASLKSHSVSRMPSLHFLLQTLRNERYFLERSEGQQLQRDWWCARKIDINDVFYILNPEQDLIIESSDKHNNSDVAPNVKSLEKMFIDTFGSDKGICRKKPEFNQFQQALQQHQLFV